MNAGYTIFASLTLFAVPFGIKAYGAAGAFALLCAATILGICLVPWLPSAQSGEQQMDVPAAASGKISGLSGLLALLALVVLVGASSVLWTFVERLGLRTGLSITDIGMILSVAALITLVGPATAHALDTRIGFQSNMKAFYKNFKLEFGL